MIPPCLQRGRSVKFQRWGLWSLSPGHYLHLHHHHHHHHDPDHQLHPDLDCDPHLLLQPDEAAKDLSKIAANHHRNKHHLEDHLIKHPQQIGNLIMQAQMPIYTRETQKQGHPLPLPGGGAVANNTLVKVVKIILKIITLVLIIILPLSEASKISSPSWPWLNNHHDHLEPKGEEMKQIVGDRSSFYVSSIHQHRILELEKYWNMIFPLPLWI